MHQLQPKTSYKLDKLYQRRSLRFFARAIRLEGKKNMGLEDNSEFSAPAPCDVSTDVFRTMFNGAILLVNKGYLSLF